MIVKACKERGIPIRIGVNAGSLDPDLLMKYGGPTPEAMVESAAKEIALLEEWGFEDIVVSLKSSDVMDMIKAYLLFAQKFPYPTHVGVTEAGAPPEGVVWSAIGIGAVLAHGIGDTIRVSLSTDPVEEVKVAKMILRALGLRREGVRIIACPSCGRCEVDLFELVEQVKARVGHIVEPLDIAVMGCIVNGPGEARIADLGIAAGRGKAALFVEGEVVKTIQEGDIVEALATLAEEIAEKKRRERENESG
jgi:(E)-4-hydroxy-3-methylbut-2-enyl-diphosphate synthase